MKRISRSVFTAGIAALLVISARCGGAAEEEIPTGEKVAVSVERARLGTIRAVVDATGTVRPAIGGEISVVAPGPARIREMPRAIGERVRKGDLLVAFDVPSLRADVSAREADVRKAEARLEAAKARSTRAQGLYERGIAAGREVEDARRELADSEAEVASATAALASARELAARETVRAPFDGVIASRSHDPGDLVDSSASEPILTLVDPARLHVLASVPAASLAQVAEGRSALVWGPGSGAPVPARVGAAPGAVDPATGTATVRLDPQEPSSLTVGSAVRVQIFASERRDVVIVPSAAIVREGRDTYVNTVDDAGRAHRVQVQVGIVSDPDAEISAGIKPGDAVVVEGRAELPDGAEVVVRP